MLLSCEIGLDKPIRGPTSGLDPLTPAPATSLLAHVLACTGASSFQLVYAGFGGSGA